MYHSGLYMGGGGGGVHVSLLLWGVSVCIIPDSKP